MPAPEINPADEIAGREIVSTRLFDFSREILFDVFINPAHLAHWWGPKGFTNTIEHFEPRPQGRWRIMMHGSDGADYPSENIFVEIVKPERVVFRHLQPPAHNFTMTMLFAAVENRTLLTWHMLFESPGECAKLRAIITAANQQNFDRLETFLKTDNPIES